MKNLQNLWLIGGLFCLFTLSASTGSGSLPLVTLEQQVVHDVHKHHELLYPVHLRVSLKPGYKLHKHGIRVSSDHEQCSVQSIAKAMNYESLYLSSFQQSFKVCVGYHDVTVWLTRKPATTEDVTLFLICFAIDSNEKTIAISGSVAVKKG